MNSPSSPAMDQRVGVIDYGGGNLRNVLNVLKFLGHEGTLVSGPADLRGIDRLVFPGVGAFGDCADELDRRSLGDPVVDWIRSDRPYFGICLGYQVLFERSSECPGTKGLGVFEGEVVQFPKDRGLKVPHMGWNQIVKRSHRAVSNDTHFCIRMPFIVQYLIFKSD